MGHPIPKVLSEWTTDIIDHIGRSGLLLSPKSVTQPQQAVKYIGKEYTATSIANTTARLASLLRTQWRILLLPYIAPSLLAKHTGQTAYCLSHTSAYTSLHYLNLILYHKQHIKPDRRLRSVFAANMAIACQPWALYGLHLHPHAAMRPHIFVDASPHGLIGLVFPGPNGWLASTHLLPPRFANLPLEERQQAGELYGILMALRLASRHSIHHPTIVADNTGAIFTGIKGSTRTFPPHRHYILAAIQRHIIKHRQLAYIAYTPSEFQPADIPSRLYMQTQPATQHIHLRLEQLHLFPSLIAYTKEQCENLTTFHPDLSPDAWSTPPSIRHIVRTSPIPPTYDLYAEPTTALATQYSTVDNPVLPSTYQQQSPTGHEHVFWFQPPYSHIHTATHTLALAAPTITCWALLPASFMHHFQRAMNKHVCTSPPLNVHFIPPGGAPGSGSHTPAPFLTVLCHVGQSCLCHWLTHHTDTHRHYA